MSRSYKKLPILTVNTKGMKKYASKHVRHCEDIPQSSRGAYKKYFESYDICDYKFLYTLRDLVEEWNKEEKDYPRIRWITTYSSVYNSDIDRYELVANKPIKIVKEEGYLHKKYKTLDNCINKYWKKYYHRK